MQRLTESTVKEAVLGWAGGLQYSVLDCQEIAPEESAAERKSFGEVLLMERLRDAIAMINLKVPADRQKRALRRIIRTQTASFVKNNRRIQHMFVDRIDVEYHADAQSVHIVPSVYRNHAKILESRDPTRMRDKLFTRLLSEDCQALQAGALT